MRLLRAIFGRAWLRRFVLLILIGLVIAAGVLLGDYEVPELTLELITVLVFVLFGLIALFSSLVSGLLSRDSGGLKSRAWWADFTQGVSTEMVGAILTGILFVFVVGAVEERQAEEQWKKELIFEMGSPNNVVAVEAARTLEAEGWLADGSLQGANLTGANLEKAKLTGAHLVAVILVGADLQRASLTTANLQSANLTGANLEGALVISANLEQATLVDANLQRTPLSNANLRAANLRGANLSRAILQGANLQGASLENVTWSEEGGVAAMLPDGSRWTVDTDLGRFTNPNHPSFWRSDNPDSPAYRGDSASE